MDDITRDYRAWILGQRLEGCTISPLSEDRLAIEGAVAQGAVSFYEIDGSTIVELRLERGGNDETLFFLHFELESLRRGQELFGEMARVLEREATREVRHVLLCCTCGVTTTYFANKLNETAQTMGVDYDFCAKPIEALLRDDAPYAAVLLAPQVGHRRREVSEALRDTPVLELPAHIFGTYDAAAALTLLLSTLSNAQAAPHADLRMARDVDCSHRILTVSYVRRFDEPTLAYQIHEHGRVTDAGMLVRHNFDEHVLDDLATTLRVAGTPIDSLDAVGIAVPGMVDDGVLYERRGTKLERREVAKMMSTRWNVPVFVDNNATAAAAGCYMTQDRWDNVAFHAQAVGVASCDQGYVVNGLPHTGRNGFAGNMRWLANDFSLSMDLREAAWRYDGMVELVARYLSATICTVAPEAIFVWCDLLPDMDDLRAELERTLPAYAIPELVAVSDYDGLVQVGELALCLRRLADPARD